MNLQGLWIVSEVLIRLIVMAVTVREEHSIVRILQAVGATSNLNVAIMTQDEVLVLVRVKNIASAWSELKAS